MLRHFCKHVQARQRNMLIVAGLVLVTAGCSHMANKHFEPYVMRPTSGEVTDMVRFESFLAQKPTPEQFRLAYPDVLLVTPGTVTTREIRSNNSRFFPKLNNRGRIIGGDFQ